MEEQGEIQQVPDMAPHMAMNGFNYKRLAAVPDAPKASGAPARKLSSIAAKIRSIEDRPFEDITIPEWENIEIRVRGMSGPQRAAFGAKAQRAVTALKKVYGDADLENVPIEDLPLDQIYPGNVIELVILCSYDPQDDSPAFSAEDLDWLAERSGAPIERIARKAAELSGLQVFDANLNETAVEAGKGSSEMMTSSSDGSAEPKISAAQ